jgi:hypothetical protein
MPSKPAPQIGHPVGPEEHHDDEENECDLCESKATEHGILPAAAE